VLPFIIALVPLLAPKTLKINTHSTAQVYLLDMCTATSGSDLRYMYEHMAKTWRKHGEHMANTWRTHDPNHSGP
jgi:hypothetical protein